MNKAQLQALVDQVPNDAEINAIAVVEVIKNLENGIVKSNPGDQFTCIIIGPSTEKSREVLNFFERTCGGVTDLTHEQNSDSDTA